MTTNSRPNGAIIAGQYGRPGDQDFKPSPPQQYAHAVPIPATQNGNTALSTFHKLNRTLSGGRPLAKIVIGTQQSRF